MSDQLISREALKKKFERLVDETIPYGGVAVNDMRELIDNAPTVENLTIFCENADEKTIEELKAEMQKAKLALFEERPQGEWIAREDFDFLDENKVRHNHFMCEKCGFIHDFIDGHTSQYNFCPQCGADLKGGAE